ncbi:hypothetical protein [Aeromicrobium sp. UC242_57]|uniref:hypothetical protein n=1 Tax=Aeromicrobium sp. UC242_57 TaxID=3374624 RepID=UPI0037BCA410
MGGRERRGCQHSGHRPRRRLPRQAAAGSDPDTVSSFDEDSTLWQVDLRSGAAKRRFTLDDPPAAWARVGDTIYVVGQSDAGDSLRAIDARNGQHLAKAPLRDLIPDLAANGLAVTGLTVLNDSW